MGERGLCVSGREPWGVCAVPGVKGGGSVVCNFLGVTLKFGT